VTGGGLQSSQRRGRIHQPRAATVFCCSARKTSREIKDLPADPDRFEGLELSNGKFSRDDLAFSVRLTTLQFPDAIFVPRRR
jgi:hypothetical protein